MSQPTFQPGEAKIPVDSVHGQLLLDSGFLSNFTIKCHGREWRVHREILADRSKYFHRMFNGDWTECETGTVEFEDDPDIIDTIVRYIYLSNPDIIQAEMSQPRLLCERAGIMDFSPLMIPADLKWKLHSGRPHALPRRTEKDGIYNTALMVRLILLHAVSDRLGLMIGCKTVTPSLSAQVSAIFKGSESGLIRGAFYEILKLAFSTTMSTGEGAGIREYLVACCLRNVEIIRQNMDVCKLLEMEEPVAWRLGQQYVSLLKLAEQQVLKPQETLKKKGKRNQN